MSTPLPSDRPQAPAAAPPRRRGLIGLAGRLFGGAMRPAALAATAAAVGLGIALAGLFHPAAHDAVATPPGVVALVNGEPILETDFIAETEQSAGTSFDKTTPAERAAQLRRMIDEELMVQRALTLDLPEQDTNVRSALGDSVTALVSAQVLGEGPTDAQLQAFFNAHRAKYGTDGSMTLTDLVLKYGSFENADQTLSQAMADAAQAAYELRGGASQDYVKQHYGLVDSGRVTGIEPDFAARIHLGDKLYPVAAALNDGAISEPVADADGVHVMIMDTRVAPVFKDFDSVRNSVFADYQQDQKNKSRDDNLKFLRRNARILLAPGHSE